MRKHLKLALEGANTMTADPASRYHNVQLPPSGVGVTAVTVKENELGGLNTEPFKPGEPDPAPRHFEMPLQALYGRQLHEELAAMREHCWATEEAAEVATALEELQEIASQGPLTANSKQLLTLSVESLLAQVGDHQALALEDGEDKPQGLKVRAHHIWQAIVQAIEKAWNWIKRVWRKFFDVAGKVRADAERVQNELKKLQKAGAKTSALVFDHPANYRVMMALRVSSHFSRDPVHDAQRTTAAISRYLKRFDDEEIYSGKFLDSLAGGKLDSISYDPEVEKSASQLNLKNRFYGETVDFAVWQGDFLLGGQLISQRLGKEKVTGARALFFLRETPHLSEEVIERPQHNPYKDKAKPHSQKLPVGSLAMAISLCEEAAMMADTVLRHREIQAKLEKVGEGMFKAAKNMLTPGEGEAALNAVMVHGADDARMLRDFLAAGPRIFAHEPTQMINYALRTAGGLVGYCEQHVKIYGGSKDYDLTDDGLQAAPRKA